MKGRESIPREHREVSDANRVRCVQEGGDRNRLDRADVGRSIVSNLELHEDRGPF